MRGNDTIGLPNWMRLCGVGETELQRVLGDADGARRGLDARQLEGLHQLPEALTLRSAEQVFRRHGEGIEPDLKFLETAIAEHLDLAAAHARGREGLGVGAARFLGDEQGKTTVPVLLGAGAGEQRHDVGAHRMGDPGLVAGDEIARAVPDRAGLQARQIRADIGLGKDSRGQKLAGGDPGQPPLLLGFAASAENQFGSDLGAGADGTDGDPAARQLFGDDAHGDLAETHAAVLFRQGQGEDAEAGEFADEIQRHIAVAAMEVVGDGRHGAFGEAAHLIAHLVERIVETAVAERRRSLRLAHGARRCVCGLRLPVRDR